MKDNDVAWTELADAVIEWGAQRGLHEDLNLGPQLIKALEELGEVAAGVARTDHNKILDGVGDLLVVLLQFGAVHGKHLASWNMDITPHNYLLRCLQIAYSQIQNRKGKTVDGVFVKQEG